MPQTSYKIRGIEPPDIVTYPNAVRKMYWQWVVDAGLKRKDKELSQGLDKDGKPLRPISAETARHRRSAMTPSGKGSPSAPPLTPGYQKSRTRSLLAGRALTTHAEFFWLYDSHTGDSWGAILADQAVQGRNVFGLSPSGTAWVQAQALTKWNTWKAGNRQVATKKPREAAILIPRAGQYDTTHATFGIGASSGNILKTGQWRGFMTDVERRTFYREEAKVKIPGRPNLPYNRLLSHVWPGGRTPTSRGGAVAVAPPKPKPIQPRTIAALAPKAPVVPVPTVNRGTPVSRALDLGNAPKMVRASAQHTIDVIDKLHGDGNLTKIPVIEDTNQERYGSFSFFRGGNPEHIAINTTNPRANHQSMTMAHEVGHFIEGFGIPDGNKGDRVWDGTRAAKTMEEWQRAIEKTTAFKELDALYGKKIVTTPDGKTWKLDDDTLDYVMRWDELWARSYAQWVATRSKDARLAKELAHEQSHQHPIAKHKQWQDADFAPVAQAIDTLFRGLGWMS